jgi:adenosylcobyric acid synthase
VEIAVVRLPHLANFDEFGGFAAEPGVCLRYVTAPEELRAPDLLVLPGSKATIPDLLWLNETGLADRIRWLSGHGTPVLGVCGGFQVLGDQVRDPYGVESRVSQARGIGLLPMETELRGDKRLARVRGRFGETLPGVWGSVAGEPIEGYEMHLGATRPADPSPLAPFLSLEDATDGVVRSDGLVAGTYVHGLFERPEPRAALLRGLAATRGLRWQPGSTRRERSLDLIADAIEANVSLNALLGAAR